MSPIAPQGHPPPVFITVFVFNAPLDILFREKTVLSRFTEKIDEFTLGYWKPPDYSSWFILVSTEQF